MVQSNGTCAWHMLGSEFDVRHCILPHTLLKSPLSVALVTLRVAVLIWYIEQSDLYLWAE